MDCYNEDVLMAQEEECRKALKTLGKALFMRLVVTALLIVVPLRSGATPLILGIVILVGFINMTGALLLAREWRKRRMELKAIMDQYE